MKNFSQKRLLAIVSSISLAASVIGSALPAQASDTISVVYNGNTIASAVPVSETQTREVAFALPGAASVTGSRTGYSFAGWSTTIGGAAVSSPYTYSGDASADNNRLDLYAVWSTTISYDSNGAESGSLPGAKTQDTYRFGQNLTLPTVGTLSRSGFSFAGWMPASISTTRSLSYQAATDAVGNPTLYAAWIKTVSFNANGATNGEVPAALVFVAGSERLKLPVASEMTLRRPGYDFLGWSTSVSGKVVSNPTSYVPLVANRTLYAIWQIQTTKSSNRVFFATNKKGLRASQKAVLDQLILQLAGKTNIQLALSATRNRGTGKALGRARNAAVVRYLESFGVEAIITRKNSLGKASLATAKKNNRVIISASWTNPS